jgi:2-octaprenyl-6-methoxyphenol hydroxylase
MKRPKETAPPHFDCFVAGGGYVGLCVALAIRDAAPGLVVAVCDPAPPQAWAKDRRASAIAPAAVRMLARLGVWARIEARTQPILRMIVTDSRTGDIARPALLTFGESGEAPSGSTGPNGQPIAHMVANRDLVEALRLRCAAAGVTLLADSVTSFAVDGARAILELGSGGRATASLLVAADGARSRLRQQAGIRTLHWPYRQSGIVVTVRHERPHEATAYEHFLPAGPFATLPLTGNRSSLVWTERSDDAERLVAADPADFRIELETRFGHRLGRIEPEDAPRAFPLGLTLAREYVRPRLALVGDAAHGIHPIAGQGLNLGFKDAAALAETVVDAHRLGQDIGALDVLERYQLWRRHDTVRMGVVTDVLNRLFANDNALLRIVRDAGLGMVERLPGLKRRFAAEAAGNASGGPKLLAGQAI